MISDALFALLTSASQLKSTSQCSQVPGLKRCENLFLTEGLPASATDFTLIWPSESVISLPRNHDLGVPRRSYLIFRRFILWRRAFGCCVARTAPVDAKCDRTLHSKSRRQNAIVLAVTVRVNNQSPARFVRHEMVHRFLC